MVWDHISATKPHLVYILLGAFTTVFMLVSSFIKERMFIGEATVATIFGVIFGPHAANLINPLEWGNVDIVTIEFSRIVLVVQCFAIGVELPKFYMERHWRSVVYLLLPVMAAGWLVVSVVVWWMVPRLNWLESLAVAACVTATDPVLASSVVGKGKFAQRVPKHLRDLLSAESGCNDGMAFPFIYLALYLIMYNNDAKEVTFHWFLFTILYECVFGAIFGFTVGYVARHGIKWAHEHDMIDRESFLVFYFVVALFCAGSGSILGVDDLLVGFAAGVGFSNDGWFGEKTEESHVSNVIDLLLNLTYFVYLGTIIPWEMFNNAELGLSAWRLSVLAIFVILFRRIPVMLALKPLIPELKNWREALFAGHFGPIGVGAIFVALLARAELEHHDPVPMPELPDPGVPHYSLIVLVWPITTFLVISSMIVHGSSVAVFTLGKRITTLPITISFTQANEDGPTWINRLPRISSMRSQGKSVGGAVSDNEGDEMRMPDLPPGAMPPIGLPYNFLRRQKEEDADRGSRPTSRASSLLSRRRKKKWDDGIGPGGPVSQSAIMPARRSTNLGDDRPRPGHQDTRPSANVGSQTTDPEKEHSPNPPSASGSHSQTQSQSPTPPVAVYAEGRHVIVENQDGEVIATDKDARQVPTSPDRQWTIAGLRKRMGDLYASEMQKRKEKDRTGRHQEMARAYQIGNSIIVEDADGEVITTYQLPPERPESKSSHEGTDMISQSLRLMGLGGFSSAGAANSSAAPAAQKDCADQDYKHIRFTINGVGRRMTKDAFIEEIRKMDVARRDGAQASAQAKNGGVQAKSGGVQAKSTGVQAKNVSTNTPRDEGDSDVDEPRRGRSATVSSTAPPRLAPRQSASSVEGDANADDAETPAERRRRMSVLAGQSDETDAEKRRRVAALVGSVTGEETAGEIETESDDEVEGGNVVPAAETRRGIRFADAPARIRGG